MTPPPEDPAHEAHKPDWQLRRDTHATLFPESLRNWLQLDPWWAGRAEAVVAATQALLADAAAPAASDFAHIIPLAADDLRSDWIADEPVVRHELDPAVDWLLLWREPDRLTVMTIEDDGVFDRVFWDKNLGGAHAALLLGAAHPATTTTKHRPAGAE